MAESLADVVTELRAVRREIKQLKLQHAEDVERDYLFKCVLEDLASVLDEARRQLRAGL